MKRSNWNNLNKTHRMVAVWLFIVLVQTVCMAAPLVIYDDYDLAGEGVDIPDTHTVYTGTGILGGLNNAISSFQLSQGYMVVVGNNVDGSNGSKTYIANEGPLTVNTLPANLDNTVSFIRVVPWKYTLKKGFGGKLLEQPDDLNVSWYYRWWLLAAPGSGQPIGSPEYVPMSYNENHADPADVDNTIIPMDQVTHLLGFNEPDNTEAAGGTAFSVSTAINLFPNLQKTGLRLCSPACTELQNTGDLTKWLPDFMNQCDSQDIRVDVVALHWYDWGSNPKLNTNPDPQVVFNRFKKYLSTAYHQYRRPLWITEFNANINRDRPIQNAFMELALPYLETLGYVERYAWFQPSTGTGSFFEENDDLTSTGQIYNDQVSAPAYTSKTLPAPWQNQDVGAVAAIGDAIYANGNFTVCGTGADIGGTADEFHYVYQPITGNGEIIARVNSMIRRDDWTKSGVMIRESLNTGSKHATMFISAENGAAYQYRPSTDGTSAGTTQAGIEAPYWVKMVRQDDTLIGSISQDGSIWVQQGSQTISMNDTVYMGLAVTSHNDGLFCDTTFTDVSLPGSGDTTSPSAPTGLTAASGNGSVSLDWPNNTEPDLSGYSVYRSETSGEPYTHLDNTATHAYIDTTAVNGMTYYYVVTAIDTSANASGYSNESVGTPQGGTPVVLVGGTTLNGDFNAGLATGNLDFVDTEEWYNLGTGDQDTLATKDASAHAYDGTRSAAITTGPGKDFGLDTGHPIVEGDAFDVSYVWKDLSGWVDVSDKIRVVLFVTTDNTLTNSSRTDLFTDFSETSISDDAYGEVDHDFIYTATAADEGKTLFVRIDSNDESAGGYARLDDFELIVTPALLGYDAWSMAHGMTGIPAAATNDYDADGVNNLLEYGLAGDPTNAAVLGTDPVLGPIVQVEGADWIEYIHLERTNTGHGLTYTIQWTADLVDQPWSNCVDAVVDGTGDASNSDFMTVTNRIPTEGKTQEFLRLRIDK